MIIIMEGCDLSGKTTAIEKIAKHFNSGFTIKNSFKPQTSEDTEKLFSHYWHILNIITTCEELNPNDLYILDRFYPSQAVYSYLRGEDEIDSKEIKKIDEYCDHFGMKLIYLDTKKEDLISRYDIRGDEHVDKSMLLEVKDRYDKFVNNTKLNVLKLDTTKKEWLTKVKEFLT